MLGSGAVLVAASAGTASRDRTFHYTHRVSAVGELVDHWTLVDPTPCGIGGDGTVTVKFRMATTPRIKLVIDPVKNGEPNNTLGSWVLGVPVGGGIGDLSPQPAAGTITRVDNTQPGPPSPGDTCTPESKSGCGAAPLSRAQSDVTGYNRRFLSADLGHVQWDRNGGRSVECRIGQNILFTDGRLTGGTPLKGELLLRMPGPAALKRRVLTVTGTTHKSTTFKNCNGSGTTCTDDVTRRVTVTFRRLAAG